MISYCLFVATNMFSGNGCVHPTTQATESFRASDGELPACEEPFLPRRRHRPQPYVG